MYQIINTFTKPVFVEGVCLKPGDSTTIESLSNEIKYLDKRGIVLIKQETENKKTLTEEGTGKKKKKSSGKILNE